MNLYYDNDIVSYNGDTRTLTPNNLNPSNITLYTSGDVKMTKTNETPAVPDRPSTQAEINTGLKLYTEQVITDNLLGYSIDSNRKITYTTGYNVILSNATVYTLLHKPADLILNEGILVSRDEFQNLIYDLTIVYDGVTYRGTTEVLTEINSYIAHIMAVEETEPGKTLKYISDDRKIVSDFSLNDFITMRDLIIDGLQNIYTNEYDPSIW